MKLLVDQNISFRLVKELKNEFPGIEHVSNVGLLNTRDSDIWAYAKSEAYTILTFDFDFYELLLLKGFPPKVVLLRFGNTSTVELISFVRSNFKKIQEFVDSPELNDAGCLEFYSLL